jgi:hypothetical protein
MSNRRALLFKKQGAVTQYLLNFDTANEDYLTGITAMPSLIRTFPAAFYIEVDFEFSAYDTGFVGLFGGNSANAATFIRMLISPTDFLVSCGSLANVSNPVALSLNTRYTFRISRDVAGAVTYSLDGGADVSVGTDTINGDINLLVIGRGRTQAAGRYLTGKIYNFTLDGAQNVTGTEYFGVNEGSGDTLSSTGGSGIGVQEIDIITSNAGGITYIDNTMWELE